MNKQYAAMDDAQLLTLLEQEEEAFNELYDRYYKLVYYIAYEMCHNDADAKDVMQETFIKVKRGAKAIRDKDRFKAWLNAVTVSKCKDLFKKNKYDNYDSDNAYLKNSQTEKRRYMLPEKQMHFDNDKALLHSFIDQLPTSQKEVLLLKYFGDLSLQEIAEVMQISEGTVKSRLHYAKDMLRGMVENHNLKEKNQPLNFESIDAAVIAAFLFAYQHCKPRVAPLISIRFQDKGHRITALGLSLAISIGGAAYVYTQMQNHHPTNEQTLSSDRNTEYRDAYFHLMDFAATRSDMENKTREQLLSVYDDYRKLKSRDNAYIRLLTDQGWITMYEEALNR